MHIVYNNVVYKYVCIIYAYKILQVNNKLAKKIFRKFSNYMEYKP